MVVMMEPAILPVKNRQAFREWLVANHDSARPVGEFVKSMKDAIRDL